MAEVINTNHKSTTFTIENGILKSYQWDRSNNVQIPSGVIEISANVFNGRTQIKMVEIPEGVTKIGAYAFKGCTALAKVKLPSTLKTISRYAFDGCGCLNKVVLPTNLEKIEEMAFRGCWSMDNLVIPDKVTDIGDWAFSGCYGINKITLGRSLKHIGTNAFEFCTGVQEVTNKSAFDIKKGSTSYGGVAKYAKKVVALSSSNEQSEIIGEEELIQKYLNASQVASIQQTSGGVASEFEICKGVLVKYLGNGGEVDIPTKVTAIGKSAFKNSLITSVNIPYTVTTIGESAFHDCHKLAKVTIGQSVKTIGDYAFINCSSLTTIEIPNSVTEIGISAFSSCSSLSILIIGKSVTKIDDGAFSNCRSLSSVNVPDSVKFIGQHAFQSCEGLKSIVIGKEVTEIRDYAFYLCKNLSYVKNRSKLLFKANTDAYGGITKYASEVINEQVPGFVIENGVLLKYIGRSIDVEIPKIVNTIEKNAFSGCSFIYMITIPKSVTTIEPYAFKDCKLSKVNYLGSVEEWCTKMSISRYSGLFDDSPNLYFNGRIEDPLDIPYGITTIPAFCFSGCASITSVNIPRTVTTIQSCAFTRCQNLNRISVDSINVNYKSLDGNLYTKDGQTLIQYAIGKKESSFTIPSTVTTIGEEAFYSCKSLSSITIPKSVTTIGMRAFRECENLKSVYNLSQLKVIKGSISNGCVAKYATQVYTELPKIPSSPIEPTPKIIPFNPDFEIKDGVLVKYKGNDGNVVIPQSVTSIGNYAFYDCTSLTSITIPDSVTSIGEGICAWCAQLKQINVDEGNPNYTSIDGNLYTKDKKSLVQYAIGKKDTSFTIPSSVTSVGRSAFYGCTSLTNITIPDSVTSIDDSAFYGCDSLKTVYNLSKLDIQKGAVTHGNVAFYADNVYTELTNPDFEIEDGVLVNYKGNGGNVVIPKSVTSIGSGAFAGRTSLTSITIPSSVKSIEWSAFDGCTSLQSITIPSSATSIGVGICARCTQLKQINVEESNENYISIDGNLYTKDGKTLIQYAIGKKDTSFTIPSSVTSVGWSAFSGCTSLTSITIPDSVTSIGKYAFDGCTSMQSITIPSSVTNIGNGICAKCSQLNQINVEESNENYISIDGNLYEIRADGGLGLIQYAVGKKDTSFTIPNSVTSIGKWAFWFCTSLKSITIPSSVTSIENYAFYGCKSLKTVYNLSKLDIQKYAITHGRVAYYADNVYTELPKPVLPKTEVPKPQTYTYPDFVIKEGVLVKYKGAADKVEIPPIVTEIESKVFEKNSKLVSVTIADSVKRIGARAFDKCTSLKEVELGVGVRYIGEYAFARCTAIEEITFPVSLMEIEKGAFERCSSLEEINNHSFIPLVDNQGTPDSDIFRKVDDDIMAFEENNYLANLVINDNVVTKYEEIKKHSEIALPKGVKAIGSEAFANNDTLEEIHTPDSLVEIGYRAFENCSKLTKVVLGSELERIAMRAFTKCASLDAIELPDTLKSIASWSFDDCTSLKEIVIPASVTAIEDGTFYGCTSLERVTFLGEIQSIGAYAFDGCVALKEINLPKNCNIDDTAFNDCTQLN